LGHSWVSSANTDFSFDLGTSFTEGAGARATGAPRGRVAADRASPGDRDRDRRPGYISALPAASAFALEDGAVYQTYATTLRGVEFLMGYYPILDRAPKGRDEGDAIQTWIRRHDEYA
jgi:predicted dithiol-disulfide oxidoreductase (DUF899 family)